MVTMDAAGRHVGGPYHPPLEWPIHTAVHAARPDLDSVAHLHPEWSTIFAVSKKPLAPVRWQLARMQINYFEVPSLITNPDLGEQLRASLGDAEAVLMRWHGSTVVGRTLEEMFHLAYSIEENARLLWHASVMGDIVPVPKESSVEGPAVTSTRTLNYFANLERSAEEQVHDSNYRP